MVWRVAHDLAPPLLARVGRKAIFENSDVIVGLWDFCLELAGACRAQRTVIGRRVIGPVLPPGRHGDPLFEKRMPAELAQTFS